MQLPVLLLLPLLVAADQRPLNEQIAGWFDQAKSYVTGTANSAINTGAATLANKFVTPITRQNWEQILAPRLDGEHEFLLYVTGGNKSCFGHCGRADEMWNLSVPIMAAIPNRPQFGYLDCEAEQVLCTAWSANLPAAWHFSFPQQQTAAGVSTPRTPLQIVPFNMTTVTTGDVIKVVKDRAWENYPEYEGMLHPIDGQLRQLGLLEPFGWLMWGMGSTPSWLIMIAISFFSRQWMAQRAAHAPIAGAQPAAGGQPAAAPAAAAGRGGGGKKRK